MTVRSKSNSCTGFGNEPKFVAVFGIYLKGKSRIECITIISHVYVACCKLSQEVKCAV